MLLNKYVTFNYEWYIFIALFCEILAHQNGHIFISLHLDLMKLLGRQHKMDFEYNLSMSLIMRKAQLYFLHLHIHLDTTNEPK